MGKCLLCQLNDANKTGSHIIPSFLMKHINGNGKRDHSTYLIPLSSLAAGSYVLWQNIFNSWQLYRKNKREN